jgi:hypothetical protein
MSVFTGFNWLRIGYISGPSEHDDKTFGFRTRPDNSLKAEALSAFKFLIHKIKFKCAFRV